MLWELADTTIELARRPLVMGILNITPDSFSDGGRHVSVASALEFALKMEEAGADIIDIGGESTRPGSTPVSLEEEKKRVLPVVEALAKKTKILLSIDTTKSQVAREALQAGAHIINDVSALLFDPKMLEVGIDSRCGWIIMHMQGRPETMQIAPSYGNVVAEVISFLKARVQKMAGSGIRLERIAVDPGIGFGKTYHHNLALLSSLGQFQEIKRPLCLGVSRKKFLQTLLGRGVEERLAGTLAVVAFSHIHGSAQIFRVHDVAQACDLLRTISALRDYHPLKA